MLKGRYYMETRKIGMIREGKNESGIEPYGQPNITHSKSEREEQSKLIRICLSDSHVKKKIFIQGEGCKRKRDRPIKMVGTYQSGYTIIKNIARERK